MELILLCDYGLDDCLATSDVLFHAKEEGYEVSVVPVGGNVPTRVALRNARKLLSAVPWPLPRVTLVDTTMIVQPERFLKNIHGEDGMGDLFGEWKDIPAVPFADWLKTLSRYILVSLGPLTLVPRVLAAGTCEKFIFMGGNVAEVPNYEGYEFNHALDKEAFRAAVLHPHIAVTMDTCRHPLLNIQGEENFGDDFLSRIAERLREMTFVSGEKGCYVWDDIAVKCLRHPEWFEVHPAVDSDGNRLDVAEYIHPKPYLEILHQ